MSHAGKTSCQFCCDPLFRGRRRGTTTSAMVLLSGQPTQAGFIHRGQPHHPPPSGQPRQPRPSPLTKSPPSMRRMLRWGRAAATANQATADQVNAWSGRGRGRRNMFLEQRRPWSSSHVVGLKQGADRHVAQRVTCVARWGRAPLLSARLRLLRSPMRPACNLPAPRVAPAL